MLDLFSVTIENHLNGVETISVALIMTKMAREDLQLIRIGFRATNLPMLCFDISPVTNLAFNGNAIRRTIILCSGKYCETHLRWQMKIRHF